MDCINYWLRLSLNFNDLHWESFLAIPYGGWGRGQSGAVIQRDRWVTWESPGRLVQSEMSGPTSRLCNSQEVWGSAWKFLLLRSSQIMPMLLVWEWHLETHSSGESRNSIVLAQPSVGMLCLLSTYQPTYRLWPEVHTPNGSVVTTRLQDYGWFVSFTLYILDFSNHLK